MHNTPLIWWSPRLEYSLENVNNNEFWIAIKWNIADKNITWANELGDRPRQKAIKRDLHVFGIVCARYEENPLRTVDAAKLTLQDV